MNKVYIFFFLNQLMKSWITTENPPQTLKPQQKPKLMPELYSELHLSANPQNLRPVN